ncbi:MAG: YraN family protein [Gemmatimonadota bacterium]|nr:YraN family protein [Gemmatimonadota bacterium]
MEAMDSTWPPSPLGRRGEALAAAYLEEDGWSILVRNFRFGRREVDLVVRRGDILAFVEVKARTGSRFGSPEEAVTWRKRREIEAVAAYFLAVHGAGEVAVRFDVVSVFIPGRGPPTVRHIEDAWRPGWR